jgi:FkbM family methyltransferase
MLAPGDRGLSAELLRWRIHEPFFTSQFFRRICKGMIVLDIGSNIGYYAVHEAIIVGSEGYVIAVEPHPHVYKALLASFKANGLKNYRAIRKALTRTTGPTEFIIRPASDLSRVYLPGGPLSAHGKIIVVDACSVDELVGELNLKRVDLVRMDVEGHEEEILEGAWNTIERFRPIICMELHVSILGLKKSIDLLARLVTRGYRIQFAAPGPVDCYPISSLPYAIYPRGDIREQLTQVFGKPYMQEDIHLCLTVNTPHGNGKPQMS